MKKFVLVTLLIIFFSSSAIISQIFYNTQRENFLEVVFLDVGQGDSIFIQTPNGYQILIDAGPNSDVVRSLSKFLPYYDRSIDLLIATHSDSDHVAGFVDIIQRFRVDYYGKNFIDDTDALNTEILNLIDQNMINQVLLGSGDQIILDKDKDIYLNILWPPKDYEEKENNDNSIVARLVYGGVSFLMTGDASVEVEEKLVDHLVQDIQSDILKSDILKAGHHGSKTSSSEYFLQKVKPEYTIISAGAGNKFGHPHEEVIQRIEEQKIKILETSVLGSIHFQSDGETVWLVD